ncbi:hypothetical protein E4U61_001596 [Claviceps capensis]|nr:hypothetical protein E4U61_001596 [Claviceps capensis]
MPTKPDPARSTWGSLDGSQPEHVEPPNANRSIVTRRVHRWGAEKRAALYACRRRVGGKK